ncbi:hypothetical protein ACJX0J_005588 [Zea mays]
MLHFIYFVRENTIPHCRAKVKGGYGVFVFYKVFFIKLHRGKAQAGYQEKKNCLILVLGLVNKEHKKITALSYTVVTVGAAHHWGLGGGGGGYTCPFTPEYGVAYWRRFPVCMAIWHRRILFLEWGRKRKSIYDKCHKQWKIYKS